MVQLVPRNEKFLARYKEYCQEFYDNKIYTFKPMNPQNVTLKWFRDSFDWYKKREQGQIAGQHISICLWAVDGSKFIGEFQLRPELNDDIMHTIGSVGYSVRISEQGKGYGKCILKKGLQYAQKFGLDKVCLLINESNAVSRHICEKFGGKCFDRILLKTDDEGEHMVCRYWTYLRENQPNRPSYNTISA